MSDPGHMHFRRMDEGTDADDAVLARVHTENVDALPDLLMGMLTDLKADAAYPVDRCEHSLQAATRALRDGRDEEYVVRAPSRHRGVARTVQPRRHRGERDEYRTSPHFERTAEFCARYDEVSFDPDYASEPMATFAPMVRRVLHKEWTPPT
jgi:predicted HD phosphohydrolase